MFDRCARVFLLAWSVVGWVAVAPLFAAEPKGDVSFNRDVKPILSQNCFACHGPDENQRKADLRLDIRESAVDMAITPGDPAKSSLIERILSDDPDERMPPAHSKKPPLSAEQVGILKKWITQQAPYDVHWSYGALAKHAPPAVRDTAWPVDPIDAYVLAGLESRGLRPGQQAARRTLARRLNFDLLGLPPTAEETAAFVNDTAPDSYERMVDRLLSSEHFGERMAIYWLDLVRYADTNGIHGDNHRDHALYRDYVINAFNQNKPFDEFTVEQLAGDLLPNPTREQQIASGYNRLNMTTREGGAQAKEYLAKYAADRVRNASTVWLGSTLGCAECHDHKFDPFLSRDFYSFAAFFADVQETAVGTQRPVKMPTPAQEKMQAELTAQIAALQQELDTPTPELTAAQTTWEEETLKLLASDKSAWQAILPTASVSKGGAKFTPQDDLSLQTSGANPAKDTYTLTLSADGPVTGIRVEALTDPSHGNQSLSRGNGNFVLTNVTLAQLVEGKSQPVKIAKAIADFEQPSFPAAHSIDGKPNTGWAVSGHQKKENRSIVFVFDKPTTAKELRLVLDHQSQYQQHNIGRLRVSLTTTAAPSLDDQPGVPAAIAALLRTPADKRSEAQAKQLSAHYRSLTPLLADVRQQLAAKQATKTKIEAQFQPVLIAQAGSPRAMRVLPRGNWLDESGPIVQPATPSFLKQISTEGRATRLDLAKWMIDPDNPLVARVFVNRLWKIMFGEGLVRSLDDFGAQGVTPTHPELLDYLAADFVANGWDVKRLLKKIALTNTYRQSSLESPELRELDPANRWLARQNRFRLDAEMVRDNALFVSRLLVDDIGGTSVKPYQPGGYWSHLNFPKRSWQADSGDAQYRRGLYTYWCRTFLHPSMLAFDAPSREESCVQRNRSNTPQQALVLLNDPTYVEAARAFGERIVTEGGDSVDQRIRFTFAQALGREPRPLELDLLSKLYAKHQEKFAAEPEAAAKLLSVGQHPTLKNTPADELAAWVSVARVVFNLHEMINRS